MSWSSARFSEAIVSLRAASALDMISGAATSSRMPSRREIMTQESAVVSGPSAKDIQPWVVPSVRAVAVASVSQAVVACR